MDNNINNKKKRIIISTSLFIVALVLIVGVTYAFFGKSKKQEQGNVIATSCFDIDLVGNNPIDLASAYPISNEDGMKGAPYTFTITNTCSNPAHYDISLESLVNTTFQNTSIKVALDTEMKLYSEYKDASKYFENSREARILTSGVINKGDSKTFNLRLWIDANAPSTEQSKLFESKIIVYGNLENTKAAVNDVSVVPTDSSATVNYNVYGDSTTTTVTCKWGTEVNDYSNTVIDATLNACTINGLTDGTNYYYQVCAKTALGEDCKKGSFTTNGTVSPPTI